MNSKEEAIGSVKNSKIGWNRSNQGYTCIIFPNYTTQQYIILIPKIVVNFREE
jgi:hypothetical protein